MKSIPSRRAKLGSMLMLPLVILTGCITLPPLQLASNNTDADLKQFRPPEGTSRIYFFHGPVRTCHASDCIDQKLSFPFSIYIDGIQMGTVTSRNNYLRADIAAGKHLLQWKDIADSPDIEQGDTEISMESGQAYFIRINKGMNWGAKTVGSAGAKTTGHLEDAGVAGQAEVLDRKPIVADRDAMQRLSGRAGIANSTQARGSSVPVSQPTVAGKLAELKDMYERGLITKDEYDAKRTQFLDAWN